jgi:hypothetical protein
VYDIQALLGVRFGSNRYESIVPEIVWILLDERVVVWYAKYTIVPVMKGDQCIILFIKLVTRVLLEMDFFFRDTQR